MAKIQSRRESKLRLKKLRILAKLHLTASDPAVRKLEIKVAQTLTSSLTYLTIIK